MALKITKNQGSIQVTADQSGFYPFDGTLTFPTNSLFTATSANTDMITFKSTSNGDVQFVGNYKDITISGRSYDTKQKFLTAFSNLANQGSVDAYTKAETDAKIDAKQGKLKAGNGITLTEDATDGTTVVKTAVSLTDNGNGAYQVGNSIEIGSRSSVRIGNNTDTVLQGQNSIVIGDHVITNGEKCIAIGNSSVVNAISPCSIVIGDSAIATGAQNIAIGDNRRCDGTKNVSIGCGKLDTVDVNGDSNVCIGENSNVHTKDNATVNESVAIGKNTRSESSYSVAIGKNAFSKQTYGIAIGSGAGAEANDKVYNSDSIAIGTFARADGNASIALGYYSKGQKGGVAIGTSSSAKAEKGIAIGKNAMASVENSVGIGYLAQTATDTPLVINAGYKTVDNSKNPLTVLQSDSTGKLSILKGDGTDERMVVQDEIEALKNAGGSGGGTVDAYTKTETDNLLNAKQNTLTAGTGITIDENNVISSTGGSGSTVDGLVIDVNKVAAGLEQSLGLVPSNLVVIGNKARAYNPQSVVIGQEASGAGSGSTAIGCSANCMSGNGAIAIGYSATADGNGTITIGENSKAKNGGGNTCIGWNTECTSGYCVALGYRAKSSVRNGISIGYYAESNSTTPLVIRAGYKTVDGNAQPLTVLQSDATGKLSILKGDGSDERIVIQDALSAGGGGTVDAYTKTETDNLLNAKQNTLTAGTGITIDENNTISLSGVTPEYNIGLNHVYIGNEVADHFEIATTPFAIAATDVTNSRGESVPMPYLQGDNDGKISIPLGDGTSDTMCLQDEIAALKAEIAALKGGASTGA